MKFRLVPILIAFVFIARMGCSSPSPSTPTLDSSPASTPQPTPALTPTDSPTPTFTLTPVPPPTSAFTPTPIPTSTATPTPQPILTPVDPFALISQESLFTYLEDLTAIQAYSGWRNSATQGEAEALDYVVERLGKFEYLNGLGMELERQSFRVFNSTELWETRLHLTVGGEEIEVPADGMRGNRDDNRLALRCDSDGQINDVERNPLIAEGAIVPFRSRKQLYHLTGADVEGKIVFLDYALIDTNVLDMGQDALEIVEQIFDWKPAGVVQVTSFSNKQKESHGSFVGDGSPMTWIEVSRNAPVLPILYVRLEDLAPAKIGSWDDLAKIETARLTWDADVYAPGTSGNLVVRIPGVDSLRAVILGAHIDSPNSPGALDDGSGTVALLEVARVLNASQIQPAVDLYLVWFGSEELGLYGSAHFAATHQELLDRAVAMLQLDCLTYPLDGLDGQLTLTSWSYGRLGDDRLTWGDYLAQSAEHKGVDLLPWNSYDLYSDNAVFIGFDVPNANLSYISQRMERFTPVHYVAHLHDPYDTVELVRGVGEELEQMARAALVAALETASETPDLRVTPRPDRRAIFVGSHTEAMLMSPLGFIDFGQTLAMEGFDVDLIPYGQPVTAADLEGADLVVVLPLLDYPDQSGNLLLYNEAWTREEIDVLEAYAANGGLLVLTNSEHRLKLSNRPFELNEDWHDVNAVAERFGISYRFGARTSHLLWVEKNSHPLVEGISYLEFIQDNGIPFTMQQGQTLAWLAGKAVIGLVDYGDASGQVLALADVGLLGNDRGMPHNLRFWQNLAHYARSR